MIVQEKYLFSRGVTRFANDDNVLFLIYKTLPLAFKCMLCGLPARSIPSLKRIISMLYFTVTHCFAL